MVVVAMRVGVSGQSRAAGPVPGDSSGHVQTVQVAQLRMPHRRTASADPRVPARGGRAFVRFVHRPDLGARTLSAWRMQFIRIRPGGSPGCTLLPRGPCVSPCAARPVGPWKRGAGPASRASAAAPAPRRA